MSTSVRALDFGSEANEYIDMLQANLPYLPHARLSQWLYHQNPEGRALAWVAAGSDRKRIIGAAAAFPVVPRYGDNLDSRIVIDYCAGRMPR